MLLWAIQDHKKNVPTSRSQGFSGPVWNRSSRPPAPHASILITANRFLAHLCWVMKPCDAWRRFSSAPLKRKTRSWRSGPTSDVTITRRSSRSTAQAARSSVAPDEILWIIGFFLWFDDFAVFSELESSPIFHEDYILGVFGPKIFQSQAICTARVIRNTCKWRAFQKNAWALTRTAEDAFTRAFWLVA